jgi:predicted hotdog family 3-hydroxylacyl-ACP dehydratase
MTEAIPPISELVPHAGRMLLLDRVLAVADDAIRCELVLRADSRFVENGRLGAWIGIEYMAQAVAAFAGSQAHSRGEPVKPGFLLGSRRYLCHRAWFFPGEALVIDAARELQAASGLAAFECRISVGEVLCAEATLSVYQPESVQDLLDLQKA